MSEAPKLREVTVAPGSLLYVGLGQHPFQPGHKLTLAEEHAMPLLEAKLMHEGEARSVEVASLYPDDDAA